MRAVATSGVLERRLISKPIPDPVRRAVLNLQVANAQFLDDFDRIVGKDGDSSTAYNILRILRGEPAGHPRREIAKRLVHRNADVTRVLDGLVSRGLVERVRSERDGRLSVARITPKGLKLLSKLDVAIEELEAEYAKKLSRKDWLDLSRLLEALYA
jgi:DNA-binding MarR family transcriptional regulator